jgi:hypothetical protein
VNKRWIFTGDGVNPPHEYDDEETHGTCVASQAVGQKYGVAKFADLVVVKVETAFDPNNPNPDPKTLKEDWISDVLRGLSFIVADITDNRLQGKAVIMLALTVLRPERPRAGKPFSKAHKHRLI